jgi:arabinose-5-phosphate isomerase
VLEIEARAILELKDKLNGALSKALDELASCKGKVIITGMGKSGIIARKIAATFSSTGTPAIYVHPGESSHGDLGMISKHDVVIAISYSGETAELAHLISYTARKDIALIGMTGKPSSLLGQSARVVLDISVKEEACPIGLAPTASTTATLAMGDVLAVCLMKRKGFKPEDFAEFHPSGSLGARLLTRVKDVMHSGEAFAVVKVNDDMRSVISKMTAKDVRGVAAVVDESGHLVGSITDGDLRRRLDKSQNPLQDKAQDLMSKNPKTIDKSEMAEKAVFVMEQFSVQSLFVVDKSGSSGTKPIGILHFQDLLKSKVR